MMYQINHTDGRTETHATFDACIQALEAEYPDLEYGHAGDISEGGDRTLCWASEEDADNDDGAKAVASITIAE